MNEMQKALINLGYLYDSADGDFGNNTENAVKKFQQANGFEDDGILTESQAEKLWKSSGAVTATRSNSGGTQQSLT